MKEFIQVVILGLSLAAVAWCVGEAAANSRANFDMFGGLDNVTKIILP